MSKPIKITIVADDDTGSGLDSAGKRVSHFGLQMDGLGSKIGGAIGPLAGLAAGAVSAQAAFDFLSDSVSKASDLNETISKSNTVFRESGATIQAWAANSAQSMGQSKQQAIDAAATFGNLFVQLGIGHDVAAQMSMQMVQLASDFASFHNADPSEVIEAQTAAFRGEYDALQRFVPTISAATVEQEALAMSHKKSTSELTAQEKALATQSLMMKGAGDAAGDFTRTSNGLANQQRIVNAEWDDAKAKLGEKLMPIVLEATTWFGDNLPKAIDWLSQKNRELQPTFEAIGVVLRDVVVPIAKVLVQAILDWVDTTSKAILKGQEMARSVSEVWRTINREVRESAESVGRTLDGFGDKMVAAIKDPKKVLYNVGKQIVQGLVDGIGDSFGTVQNKLGDLTGKIKGWKGPPEKDAKLLTPAGQSIIESLMVGIDQKTPALKSQLNRLTDAMSVNVGTGTGTGSVTTATTNIEKHYHFGDVKVERSLDELLAQLVAAEALYG